MRVKKILKVIGIIILVILILFLIHATRNYIILNKLYNNSMQYVNSNNYHLTMTSKNINNGLILNGDYYKKNDKEVIFLERVNEKDNVKMSMYKVGGIVNTYVDTAEGKTVNKGTGAISVQILNIPRMENKFQAFFVGSIAIIRNKKYNDKDCYIIDNLINSDYLVGNYKTQFIVEKETGLVLEDTLDDTTVERKYEFDNVDDEIFIEPDINEYNVQE